MTDLEREYFNAFVRVRDFGAENAADFPAAAAGGKSFKAMREGIERVEASGEIQESNVGRAAALSKQSAVAAVWLELRDINRTARALAVDKPEFGALFRMPHGDNLQKLAAAAMDFYTNSADREQDFIDYGLPADFRGDLRASIDDLQAATSLHNEAKSAGVGATGAVKSELDGLRDHWKRLLGIVPNVYRDNPAKLAAWASASHVARPKRTAGAAVDKTVKS